MRFGKLDFTLDLGLLLFMLTLARAAEPPITVQAKVDKNMVTIGDRIKYSLIIRYHPKIKLLPHNVGTALGDFEIKDVKTFPEQKSRKLIVNRTDFILASFKTGKSVIPPRAILYQDEQGSPNWVLSDSIAIEVKSVPTKATDKDDIRGLKPPWEMPGSIWIYVLLLGLAGLAGFGYWYYRKFIMKKPIIFEPEIKRPAWEVALEELEKLKNTDLVNTGQVKEYYFILSEILRKYIENRFNLACIDRTTEEIKQELKNGILEDKIKETFLTFLTESDLVKFAKYVPPAEKPNQDWQTAYDLVRETIPPEPQDTSTESEELLEVGHV